MYVVYVQDPDGNPLDPTRRFGKVRRMLRDHKAKVVRRNPFTIRLLYGPETHVTHHYIGCTDPGRSNIGNAVVRMEDAKVVYTDHVETRNREIPGLMSDRRSHRQASRRGERLARKRLAKANHTLSTKLENGRMLFGCEEPLEVKDIINTEARFSNRKRPKGWITPTVRHLVETHLNHVDQICSILPVTGWSLEINRFAFMRLEDGTVQGVDFQNGKMKGYRSVEDYVYALQDGKCACCKEPIHDIHHIYPRHKGGSDGPDNRVGLCDACHHKVHTGDLDIDQAGVQQRYGALSVLNQAVPYILQGLTDRFGEKNVYTCTGYDTSVCRKELGLPKEHYMDAVAVGAATKGLSLYVNDHQHYEVKQYRRQDRSIIKSQRERTYKERYFDKDKNIWRYRTIARNRKAREEQKGLSLDMWFDEQVRLHGSRMAEKMRSQLKVIPSTRRYNDPNRIMPGALFSCNGEVHVLSGTLTNGAYFRAADDTKTKKTNYPASKCRILCHNVGLVYGEFISPL